MEVKTDSQEHPNAAPKQPQKSEFDAKSYRELSVVQNIVHWSPGISLESMERQVILAAFRYYRGNKTATAQSLGIAIRTLDNKLEKYQSEDKQQEERENATESQRAEFLKASRGLEANVERKPTPAADEFIRQREERRRAREAEGAQRAGTDGDSSKAGVRMESSSQDRAERSMPLPVGSEVQKVSSRNASTNRQGRGR